MATNEFRLPDPGEGLVEAEIVTWRVAVGDEVKVNDILVEIETAKSLVELPSPYAGTVTALLVDEGQLVDVGAPIVAISDGADVPGRRPSTRRRRRTRSARALGDDVTPRRRPRLRRARRGDRVANLVGYGPRSTEARRRPAQGRAGARRRVGRRDPCVRARRRRRRCRPRPPSPGTRCPPSRRPRRTAGRPVPRGRSGRAGQAARPQARAGPGRRPDDAHRQRPRRDHHPRGRRPGQRARARGRSRRGPDARPTGRPVGPSRRPPTRPGRPASPSRGCARRRRTRWCARRSPRRT